MIPVSIYALTRIDDTGMMGKLERQMSRRKRILNVKGWEVEGIGRLSDHLYQIMPEFPGMKFFYSFMIPKIGKEFDLLRISKDYVVNIELKSKNVSEEVIKKQLIQNRYYLSSLGRNIRSYTYISGEDRLFRLSKGEYLVEADWDRLKEDLLKQQDEYDGDVEDLFDETHFLISPLTDSEKFLNREYFLTYQQRDIRNQILKNIARPEMRMQGFYGLPGTGKTLLLYDIAMSLSVKQRVCVLHFGFFPDELKHLNERLKRIDFYSCRGMNSLPAMDEYAYILVDEGHQMNGKQLDELLEYSSQTKTPVIFAYDQEEAIVKDENDSVLDDRLAGEKDYIEYSLTNRIRMNKELSTFIHSIVCPVKYSHRREYPSVELAYAGSQMELDILLGEFNKNGYVYIEDASDTTCKEFDKVVMVIDDKFYYDAEGNLRANDGIKKYSVRNLFHGLNRAKNNIGIVVYNNETMLGEVLNILQ